MMTSDIKKLKELYPEVIDYQSLGQTQYGREIWAVKLGHGDATLFINGSHHAREWITTTLSMNMIQQYAKSYYGNENLEGYQVRNLLNDVTIWFVPMVNPDGVTLQQQGIEAFPGEVHNKLIEMNNDNTDFTRWKANASGVDLNRNYDVQWETIPENDADQSWAFHKGSEPFSTTETQIIRDFTEKINPMMVLAYHTSGQKLYWHYNHESYHFDRDKKIAQTIENYTGYPIDRPKGSPSGGTYTDWFIQEYLRPAFTLELNEYVEDRHVPVENFPSIWKKNKLVPLYAAQESYQIWTNRQQKLALDEEVYLTSQTTLFQSPRGQATQLNLTPQPVKATAVKGDWFQIKTFAGDMWIRDDFTQLTPKEKVDESIQLAHKTRLYEHPSYHSKIVSSLASQTVRAKAKWGDWYLIKTWIGDYWVKPQ
ncbi:M14 family metallopeptidase [Tenuibacillus multivorans]|nr:M14 family metallocarboxypeptidase [Tenuibacillus multivorans]